MALDLADHFFASLPQLRFHPTAKRIRAFAGDKVVVDSTGRGSCGSHAVSFRRMPSRWRTSAAHSSNLERRPPRSAPCGCGEGPPVLDPTTGFSFHTTPGQTFDLATDGSTLASAAFVPDDPDFEGYVIVDFDAFDEWREEDELLVGHARDPFTTIDTRRSSRRVVVEIAGAPWPTRRARRCCSRRTCRRATTSLETTSGWISSSPPSTTSVCAYKGLASYWTATIDDTVVPDVAWSYPHPHNYATAVKDLLSFFNERVDIIVDGQRVERPQTPWS